MSIDTKEKRQAIFSIARPWQRNSFPVATPDEQWRMSVGNVYGGNALSFVVSIAVGIINIHQISGAPVLGAPASDIGMVSRRNDRRIVGAVTPEVGIVRRRK